MQKRTYTTPEQKREIMIASGLLPLEDFQHKDKPWKSQCMKCQKIVTPRFGSIRNGQGGCKYCAGVFLDVEDAEATLSNAGFKPLEPYRGAAFPWKSQCKKCGKISSPTLSNIKSAESGCKFCAAQVRGQKSKLSVEEILSTLKAADLEPIGSLEYESSKVPILCLCLICNHTISPTLNSIRSGRGCAYCSKKRVVPDEAINLMLLQGVQPLEPYKASNSPWKCICLTCNREVAPTYGSVQQGGAACAYCAGKRIDLQDASKLMHELNLLPLEPFPGSAKPWKSQCLICGLPTSPRLSNLKNGHKGCLNCAGKFVDPENAAKVMLESNLQPLVAYSGRHTPWRCRCLKCDREVSPTYGSVTRGSGCKFCAEIGIDYTAAGYVYLITHQGMQSHKIGIANTNPRKKYYDRLLQHESKGWITVSRHEFSTAEIAMSVEQEFLKWVREDLGLGVYLSQKEMPQGGYTETFSGYDPVHLFSKKLQEISERHSRDV